MTIAVISALVAGLFASRALYVHTAWFRFSGWLVMNLLNIASLYAVFYYARNTWVDEGPDLAVLFVAFNVILIHTIISLARAVKTVYKESKEYKRRKYDLSAMKDYIVSKSLHFGVEEHSYSVISVIGNNVTYVDRFHDKVCRSTIKAFYDKVYK